jgi:hypothetical protein
MTEVITWLIITGIVFLLSILCFFLSVIRKKLLILYLALFFLFSAMCTGAYSVYVLISKTRNRIADYFRPRSGAQIYTALFGEPDVNCVQVKNHKDQLVPRLDCCIWLEFRTCPAELDRILKQKQYIRSLVAGPDIKQPGNDGSEKPFWWTPEVLGDTVTVMYSEEPDRWITFYISKDSSKVFYKDMAD